MTLTGEAWQWPRGLDAFRVTEIPRRDDPGPAAAGPDANGMDPGRPQRIAALTAAYYAGLAAGPGTIAFGWLRTDPAGPVHVVSAGHALVGGQIPGSAGDLMLTLPGGARATTLSPEDLTGMLGQLSCWRGIAGVSDGLLVADAGGQTARRAPGLEDRLMGSWLGPFGWMIVATPIPAPELRTFAGDVARRLHLAESAADRFPERAVEAKRLTQRHAEVRRGASGGFWRISIGAGARDAASAARVAALFCASAALDGLPYTLVPVPPSAAGAADSPAVPAHSATVTDPASSLSPETASGPSPDYGQPEAPLRGSTELLAALARPPEAEVPGMRLALRPDFDVTPEEPDGTSDGPASGTVGLGDILDRNLMPAGPFTIPLGSLNRHVFVCGATGAGKSHTVRGLLAAASDRGIPWLVIEPAKAEYRLMANRLPDGAEVVRIRPGEADAIAAGLNPLEPAIADGAAFPLQTHADLVRALFVASFRSDEPFPQVLSAALTRVYEEAGWDLALGEPIGAPAGPGCQPATSPALGYPALGYPALGDLQRAAERVVTEIGYSQRVTDDVLGFIRVRIASLRAGTTGRFLEGGHPIDFAALLRRNVVLEIEDVGDDRDKAFLMGTVLIRLAEHLRLTRDAAGCDTTGGTGLRHLTVVEEAHRLLRQAEPGADAGQGTHAVEMFAGLLAEIRAYGEGLVIAEQIPSKILSDAVKNTAVKIVHRLPAADDRDAVGATMNLTPAQSRYLVTLPPGQAAAFRDGMDFPVLVRITDATGRESRGDPRTRDCTGVITPRSASCGAECASRPCTLREMRQAQHVLARHPWLILWAELTVLGHLAGWPMPVPKPPVLAGLRQLPPRLAQCAVSHAVDAAVASRLTAVGPEARRTAGPAHSPAPGLAPSLAPSLAAGLAAHACAAISTRVERDTWLCAQEEPQWRPSGPVTDTVIFGGIRPSALELALRPRDAAEEQPLADFVDCRWPLRYVTDVSRQ